MRINVRSGLTRLRRLQADAVRRVVQHAGRIQTALLTELQGMDDAERERATAIHQHIADTMEAAGLSPIPPVCAFALFAAMLSDLASQNAGFKQRVLGTADADSRPRLEAVFAASEGVTPCH